MRIPKERIQILNSVLNHGFWVKMVITFVLHKEDPKSEQKIHAGTSTHFVGAWFWHTATCWNHFTLPSEEVPENRTAARTL